MDILLNDIRYAARKLFRSPGFTLVAVTTLALAIGATTSVFSIVNGVLLRPLPLRAPNELVGIGVVGRDPKNPTQLGSMSMPDYLDYASRSHSFVGTTPLDHGNANLVVPDANPVRLTTNIVGANFFELLGVSMEKGRGFLKGEDAKGAAHVVVISDKLWRGVFNADPNIVGRAVTIDGKSYSVVGVAPRELVYPYQSDAWVPFVLEDWMTDPDARGSHFMNGIARLRPGVTVAAAARDLRSISDALEKAFPQTNTGFHGNAVALSDTIIGNARTTLYTMLGAVAFVLLIACANVANLLLIRASTRETEMALRTALGAGRGRIVRQLVTESVILSLAGAVLGAAIAAWSVDLIVAFGPKGLPRVTEIGIDARVLAFTAAIAILTGVIFGLVPALYAARPELAQMLRDSGRSSSARRRSGRVRSALVVAEVALAVVLLVGAGLLIRSYVNLIAVDPGFRPEHVVTFNVAVPDAQYQYDRDKNRFANEVLDALRSLPATSNAAVGLARPMQAIGMRTSFEAQGEPRSTPQNRRRVGVRPVSADYFSTLGIPFLRGRGFSRAEDAFGPPPVVVVSESFVKTYYPNENVLGKHITLGIAHDTAEAGKGSVEAAGEIVGVVPDVKQNNLSEAPYPYVYIPHGTLPENDMAFVVRSTADLGTLTSTIRKRMTEIDAKIPVYDMETMTEAVSGNVAQPRFYTELLAAFAGLALLLAALGIYGVISYGVSQRIRELGIRIALGATNERILKLVLGQGLGLVVVGLCVGIAGAFGLTRVLASMLFGVQATDLSTFAIVPVVLGGIALLASWLPARRASRVDPVSAMRSE